MQAEREAPPGTAGGSGGPMASPPARAVESPAGITAASPERSTVWSNGQGDRPPPSVVGVKKRKYDIAFKGVYACLVSGGNYWQAQISIHGNTHHLGVFSTPEEAARAYDDHARPLGRKLNFP
jgi:hypothetical protein